jgi:tRNA(Ile)-lysidine synthase
MMDEITNILNNYCQIEPGRPILLGVSGGPDSVCLFHLLVQLGYTLIVAHLNHGLRPEAAEDAEFVRQLANQWETPFVLGQEDVAEFASQNGYSVEEGARVARYRFLAQEAAKYDAQAIAVAHTADDQVETVLMHFLRGTGSSGLRGMAFRTQMKNWGQDVPLVRPLLSTWREEIWDYLKAYQLPSRMDQSNLDVRFHRNRLRHELIPYLESYNPAIRQSLWRMAEILRGDDDALEEILQAAWNGCLAGRGDGYVILNGDKFRARNTGIQRRLLRKAIGLLRPGLRDIDFDAIERGIIFIQLPITNKQVIVGAGIRIYYEGGAIWLASEEADLPTAIWPQIRADETYFLPLPGTLSLPGGWFLRSEILTELKLDEDVNGASWPAAQSDPYQAWMDADQIQTPLQIRARKAGDRFYPLGMDTHSLKLSDFMINVKLPKRARDGWPLVTSNNVIAWVPGLRLAHPFRITALTRRQVHLWLERLEIAASSEKSK